MTSHTATSSSIRPSTAASSEWQPLSGNGFRELGIAFLWACAIAAPSLGIGGWMIHASWQAKENVRLAAIEAALSHERLVAAPPGEMLLVSDAARGRDVFMSACITCHGPTGTGVTGLGKNLVESDFVASQTDDDLHHFIIVGRPNARPVAMPPRAAREDLTDDDLRRVVVYLRGLQDARRMPELPAMVVIAAAPTEAAQAESLAAAGGDAELASYIASGNTLFHTTCIACHGKGGVGLKGNGKALVQNEFVKSLDDDALLAFIKRGRDPSDPKNTTGVGMPAKGGNPALSEDDLLDVISYIRTLQVDKPAASAAK